MKKIIPAVAIIGPTAIGKTGLALEIAEEIGAEIVSMDSMQVYRHMDIGTAKPSDAERANITHYLIDIADPDEDYNAGRFVEDARHAMDIITDRGKIPLLVGGTGLYLKALTDGLFEIDGIDAAIRGNLKKRLEEEGRAALFQELLKRDPLTAERIHPKDTQRLLRALEIIVATGKTWSQWLADQKKKQPATRDILKIGLACDRDELYQRINLRTGQMFQNGLQEEVQRLFELGYSSDLKSMQSIGYRHMVNYLQGRWDLPTTIRLLARDTRRYAKRQHTWFKRDSEINWFHPAEKEAILTAITAFLKNKRTRPS